MTTIIYTQEDEVRLKNELKDLVDNHSTGYGTSLKSNKRKYLMDFVNYKTPKLQDAFYKTATKVYWILNDLSDFPVCPHCGKQLKGKNASTTTGYLKFCSMKCRSRSAVVKEKTKQTCLEKYGAEYQIRSIATKAKIKDTMLDKYGVENPYQVEIVKDKIQQTMLDRYGHRHPMLCKQFKAKLKNTCIEKYGVNWTSQLESAKLASKQTCLEKYGVEYSFQSENNKAKAKQTCLAKYGVEYVLQVDEIKEKTKQTFLKRYGVENPAQNRAIRIKSQRRYCFEDVNFDSAPELALYIYLKDHNIDFKYQPDAEFWYTFNNKKRKYMPDFKINDTYVEIKGSHFLDKETNTWVNPWNSDLDELYEAKHQCCLTNNVKIIYTEDYQQYLDYISEKYNTMYLKQFKNYLNQA